MKKYVASIFMIIILFGPIVAQAAFEWKGDGKGETAFEKFINIFKATPSSDEADVRFEKATVTVAETDAKKGSFVGDGSKVVNSKGNYCEKFDNDCESGLKGILNFNLLHYCTYDDAENGYDECVFQ